MDRRPSALWFLFLAFLAFSLVGPLAVLATDGMWFASQGHTDVFTTTLAFQALAGLLGATLVAGPVALAAAYAMARTRNRPVVLGEGWRGTVVDAWVQRPGALASLLRTGTLALGALAGLAASGLGETLLGARHAVPFGTPDPILGMDPAFYVFHLPLLLAGQELLLFGTVVSAGVALGVYVVRGAIRVVVPLDEVTDGRPRVTVDPKARRHLATTATVAVLLIAVRHHLSRFLEMIGSGDLIDGPGYTAVNVVLPLLTAQAVGAAIAGFLLFNALDQRRPGLGVLAAVVFGLPTLGSSFVPGAVQRFLVEPNELAREEIFLSYHIQATRRAWGLSDVEERELTGQADLAWEDIENNRTTIDSIRLWDHALLLETFEELQEIRTYYDFANVDNDRYRVDGRLRQTMLSPRELVTSSLPEQARSFVNESLVYTHGYGLALGPVNEVTEQGLPYLWVKDVPPQVTHTDPLRIDQPAIYFGEQQRRPVFVRTRAEEFDFPTAASDVTTTYDGKSGVGVGNLLARTLVALRLGSTDILLSNDLHAGSRVLLHRNVAERVQRLAPFLSVDHDPYLVIADGRLVWIVEAYTLTDHYPYSDHDRIDLGRGHVSANYVRNSVKAVVDAYDGGVVLYRMEGADPLVDTWAAAFPDLFRPVSEMPATLREHLQYPAHLFEVQARLFATFHMVDSGQFYNREDEWQVAETPTYTRGLSGESRPTRITRMEPYYNVLKLPGEDTEEFILMLPFTPRQKPNLAAWMVARSDGDDYGGLRVYRFPKDRQLYGPSQVSARIRQNDAISEKLTLWGQGTSEAPLGTLLVIPVEESLLYIQPLYLRASSDAIPELKRVIVSYEDRIAMQPTLDAALRDLFDGPVAEAVGREVETEPGKLSTEPPPARVYEALEGSDVPALTREARSRYEAAIDASREGRWADFGDALDALGEALEALEVEAAPEATIGDAPDDAAPPPDDGSP